MKSYVWHLFKGEAVSPVFPFFRRKIDVILSFLVTIFDDGFQHKDVFDFGLICGSAADRLLL